MGINMRQDIWWVNIVGDIWEDIYRVEVQYIEADIWGDI